MNNKNLRSTDEELISIDLQRWARRLLTYWWLFLLSFGIAGYLSHRFVKNAVRLYSTSATLLIKDAGRSGGISEGQILFDGLMGGAKSMDNEIQILRSMTLMERVAEKLRLNVQYLQKKGDQSRELYDASPLVLDSFSLAKAYPYGLGLEVELLDSTTFRLRFMADSEGEVYPLGSFFNCSAGLFKISLREGFSARGKYSIRIRPIENIAFGLKTKIAIERVGSQTASSILNIEKVDPIPQRAADVVNTLIEVYNEAEVTDKNSVLDRTIDFIDARVQNLTKELDRVESNIEQFKSRNELLTDNAASSRNFVLGEIRTTLEELSEYEVKKEILRSLEILVQSSPNNQELLPANLIVDNPVLGNLVNQYNSIFLERERIAKSASEQNPARILLEQRLVDMRTLILASLQNLQTDLQIPMRSLEEKVDGLKSNLGNVPSIDKQLVEQLRTQSIKESLFLYLLRKREETALSKVVTTANTRMVDPARVPSVPIYPKKRLIYTAAAGLGILAPLLLITLLGFFETKIRQEETITRLTSIPIVGRIPFSKKKEVIVINKGKRTAIAEMFRLLRTNLNYLNATQQKQVVLVTSSVAGEGKSFVALNLAMTIALANKKVVLLGADMRRPKMYNYLQVTNDRGLSNYLIQQAELDEVLQQHPDHANFSYITSGIIPPNPAELFLTERMEVLMEKLRDQFDYIIIDSPPIGLVSDALLLRKFVTNLFIVVRYNYTKKRMLKDLESLHQNNELPHASLVFNALRNGSKSYGYGGTYGKGYYIDE
ncbi:MAG: GumC family protein [Saprospiraceae bacterium]